MTQQTVLWIDVLDRYVVDYEYVALLDCTDGSVWRELENVANYEIENGAWVGLDDRLSYTLQGCDPRKVNRYASVTIIATNDLDEMLAHTSPPDAAKQSKYFNEDTATLLSARDKFNCCDVDTWTDAHVAKLGAVVAVACDADILDFIIALLAAYRHEVMFGHHDH